MENMERAEKSRRKLAFGLNVKQQEINGSGKGAVSARQEMGSFLEEVGLKLGLPGVGLGSWEPLGSL